MNDSREQTLVLFKPSALEKGFCGKILARFERAGLKIEALKMDIFSREIIEELYAEHRGKDFYNGIVSRMSSKPVIALVLGGERAISKVRRLIGSTDPNEAAPGSIRGDFAISLEPDNLVHASDSNKSAEREIALFFPNLKK